MLAAMRLLKPRSDLHLSRKFYHVLGVLMMLVIYHNVPQSTSLWILAVSAGIIIPFEIGRQRIAWLNRVACFVFGPVMRRNELHGLSGTTFIVIGAYILVFFFPRPITTLALLFLAIGDPVASAVGVLYGRDRIVGKKTLQGAIACFGVCFLISLIFFVSRGVLTERLMVASLLAGLIGTLAEIIPVGPLDDNLTLPLVSAIFLLLLSNLLGGF